MGKKSIVNKNAETWAKSEKRSKHGQKFKNAETWAKIQKTPKHGQKFDNIKNVDVLRFFKKMLMYGQKVKKCRCFAVFVSLFVLLFVNIVKKLN